MDPMTIAMLLGLVALVASDGKGAYGEGSTKYLLTPGTYRVKFRSAKPQTADLQVIWAIPQMTMGGTGMLTRFESMTVDADPNYWWFTGLASYDGQPKTVDLLPNMSLQKLT